MVESVARSEGAPRTCPDAAVTPADPVSPTSTSPRNVDDMTKQLEQRKKNASQLAGGYTKEKQMMETVSIFTFTGLFVYCLWNLQFVQSGEAGDQTSAFGLVVQTLLATLVALLAADFVGGFAHWLFDTWGTLEFPVFGPTFIRSFREHHVNPSALAHHDWREANGDNCLVVLIALIPLAFATVTTGSTRLGSGVLSLPLYIGLLWFSLFVTLTNQIHKWAHMRPKEVPEWVKKLQARGVIMSRKHHNTHHSTFDAYYCITTGWMNYPLEAISFWRNLENMITLATGVQPRMDDLKWTAGFGTTDGLVKQQ